MKERSKRFTPTKWTERLVPLLLGALVLGLLVLIAGVILSGLGWMPSF